MSFTASRKRRMALVATREKKHHCPSRQRLSPCNRYPKKSNPSSTCVMSVFSSDSRKREFVRQEGLDFGLDFLSSISRAIPDGDPVVSIAGEHQRSANLFLAPVLQTGFGEMCPFWTEAIRAMIPVVKLVQEDVSEQWAANCPLHSAT